MLVDPRNIYSADNIRVVSITLQFEGENTNAIVQYISTPQDVKHPIVGYE
jgi:hypothetical protein